MNSALYESHFQKVERSLLSFVFFCLFYCLSVVQIWTYYVKLGITNCRDYNCRNCKNFFLVICHFEYLEKVAMVGAMT